MSKEKGMKRRYVYHKNNWFFSLLSIALLIVSFTPNLVGHNHVLADIAKDPLSGFSFIAYFGAFFLLHALAITAIIEPYYSRPIEVDEEGIRSYIWKKVFKKMKWEDVKKIRVPWALYFPYEKGSNELQIVFTVYSRDGVKIDFFNDILYKDLRNKLDLPSQFAFSEIVYYIFTHIDVERTDVVEYRDKFYLFPFFKGKRITNKYTGYPSWWNKFIAYVKEKKIDRKLNCERQSGSFNSEEKKEIKDDLARLRKMFGNDE